MKKQLKTSTIYHPNRDVKITVINKPAIDDTGVVVGYDADITVKIKKTGLPAELKFTTDDELADFICNTDYTEPQTSFSFS